MGYAAFILQYRVPIKYEGALQDAQRAIRIVRENAKKWDLDPEKIGIMGFSAGGNLSARACTNFNKRTYTPVDKTDDLSCRQSFAMLVYPASLDKEHSASLAEKPGGNPAPSTQVSNETPPFFIFAAEDDRVGPGTLVMASALRDFKIPVELHYVPTGGHGYALRPGNPAAETWPLLAEKWLTRLLSGSGYSLYSKEWVNN